MLNLPVFPLGGPQGAAHALAPLIPEPMTDTPRPERTRAILMLVLATLYWGVSFPITKTVAAMGHALVPDASSWFLSAMAVAPRFALAAFLVLIFRSKVDRNPTAPEIRQGLLIAFFGAAGALLQADGIQFTSSSTSAFLTQLSAILIPAWLALRRWRSPGAVVWICSGLVLAGVAVLSHVDWHNLRLGRGESETILCAVFFVGQILTLEQGTFMGNRAGVVTLVMFAAEGAAFLMLAAATAPRPEALLAPWRSGFWVVLTLVLTVVCTVGAFSIMNKWQPRITATEAGLIYCVEPLATAVFVLFIPAWLSRWSGIDYPNETATRSLIGGGGLITLANVIVLTRKQPKKAV